MKDNEREIKAAIKKFNDSLITTEEMRRLLESAMNEALIELRKEHRKNGDRDLWKLKN